MKKAQGLSLNVIIIASITLILLVLLVDIFTGKFNYDKFELIDYDEVCNHLDFYPPFKEKELRIKLDLKNVYDHRIFVDCTTKEGNQFYEKDGDTIKCKMNCYTYHYTKYYYIPLYFWYEFNYIDYQRWKEERP